MITWNNLDTLESFKELSKVGRVDIKEAMSGDNGAKRVKEYNKIGRASCRERV